MQDETLFSKYVRITIVVLSYWFISILTVFVNKALLSSESVKLDAPLFVTWYQCLVSALICFTLSKLSKICPRLVRFPEGNPMDTTVMAKVVPLSILFTAMVASNNLCLKYVDIAFYYIGRSLTTIWNVMFSYILLGQKTSRSCLFFCIMIIGGFLLGVDQEGMTGKLSILGVIFGIIGSLTLSLFSIHTKRILPYVNDEIWLLSYYNNVYSVFIFIPLILVSNEIGTVMNYPYLNSLYFWTAMTIGGLCGLAIGFATSLQIKVTSPLTHNISGTAKACGQTVLATTWFHSQRSFLWWCSNIIVLAGSAGYTRIKQQEMEAKHAATSKV